MQINDNFCGKEVSAMKKNLSQKVAKKTVAVLDSFLRTDANSASCCIVYQPKAPKELAKFRRTK